MYIHSTLVCLGFVLVLSDMYHHCICMGIRSYLFVHQNSMIIDIAANASNSPSTVEYLNSRINTPKHLIMICTLSNLLNHLTARYNNMSIREDAIQLGTLTARS